MGHWNALRVIGAKTPHIPNRDVDLSVLARVVIPTGFCDPWYLLPGYAKGGKNEEGGVGGDRQ